MASHIDSGDGDMGFQIAPMVDVVFVLMLFFMACSGALQVEREMPFTLPGGDVGRPPITVGVLIEISSEGSVYANSKRFAGPDDSALVELRHWLGTAIRTFGQDPVVIRPGADVRQERVIQVLAAAADAGVKNLSFN